jgi:hypothetical protein
LLESIQCTMTSSSACTRLWCPPSSNATSYFGFTWGDVVLLYDDAVLMCHDVVLL